jgi:hypothetical protein
MGEPEFLEPIAERFKVPSHGAEGAALCATKRSNWANNWDGSLSNPTT